MLRAIGKRERPMGLAFIDQEWLAKHSKVILLSILANILTIPLTGVLFYSTRKQADKIRAIHEDYQQKTHEMCTRHAEEIERVQQEKAAALDRLREEKNAEIAAKIERYERLLRESQKQYHEVLHDADDVSAYLELLKTKIRSTNALSSLDIERMAMIIRGIDFLIGRYQAPLSHFRELEQELIKKLEVTQLPPNKRFAFFRRVFSKDYRRALDEYNQYVGRREAVIEVRRRLTEAYEKARADMSGVEQSMRDYVDALEQMNEKREYDNDQLLRMIDEAQDVLEVHEEFLHTN